MHELPNNRDAEQAVIASVLMNRHTLIEVAPWLTADMFYSERHTRIWSLILDIDRKGEAPTMFLVAMACRRAGQAEDAEYVLELAMRDDIIPTQIEAFARQVEDAAISRQLVQASTQIAQIAYDAERAAEQKIGDASHALAGIQAKGQRRGLKSLAQLTDGEHARVKSNTPGGIPTGFRDLDTLTGGLHNSDLLIIAGRPAMGKTSFVLNLAYEVASINSRDVLLFELEMSHEQLTQRSGSMYSGVDLSRVRHLTMSAGESGEYLDTLDSLAQLPVFVDDTPGVSLAYIRNETYRHMARRAKPAAVIVDYLQLMAGASKKSENRVQEVSEISRGLKLLARELDCPVIALSQLSRKVEDRPSKIPMLSDLRESGSIEQDADIVAFLYREEYYDPNTEKKGVAELHIAKHRQGPIDVVSLRFDKNTTRFSDLSYRSVEGY
jgi:replicative DNA helicase